VEKFLSIVRTLALQKFDIPQKVSQWIETLFGDIGYWKRLAVEKSKMERRGT
jgi:hypothetical protein